jgi:uncharacterized membrane protein
LNSLPLILTVFIACVVEAVEALTIVLATGITREWRSTFQGMAVALVTLAVITAAVGPAINELPLTALRVVVGALLATGYKALHDEASAYLREVTAAQEAQKVSKRGVTDWYSFTLAFKGVLLEGLEVVFIVVTFGDNQKNYGAAVIGAAAAIVLVTIVGIAVRAPLTKVPENWMKLAVGVMLTSFGTFWGAEGAGAHWPGNDAALLVVIPVVAVVAAACIVWLNSRKAALTVSAPQSEVVGS